jgi:surface antigen
MILNSIKVETAKLPQLLVSILAASGLVFTVAELATMKTAQAADYCQCVEYVKRVAGIPASDAPGNAKDMGSYLQSHGWTRVNSPQVGAISILGTSFPNSDPNWGHVGIVSNVRTSGNNTYISLRAANQGGRETEANCYDVNTWAISTPVNGRGDVAFYVKGATTSSNATTTKSFHSVNFTGVTNGNVNTPAVSGTTTGYIRPNTTVTFDGWIYGTPVNDLWTGRPDRRYYRVAGTTWLVPSAYINGNAPGSQP